MRLLVASVLIAPLAFAQAPAAGAASPKVVSGRMGLSFTSHYYFRGILQENQGIIAQPWLEVGYGLYEGKDTFRNLGLTFGLWNSLHDGPTGTGGGNTMWYESDFFIELSADIGERLSVGATYTSYYGANGVKPNVEELAFSATYNDEKGKLISALESGLQPSVVLAFELDGQQDAGGPGNLGTYLQLGVAPSFPLGKLGKTDVTLSVPVTMGLSLGDYYEFGGDDEFFGFFDVGAEASCALPWMPSRLGPWTAELGLHWITLGDSTQDVPGSDSTELIISLGLSTKW
ncbi:MAG TPA: hypothetical protein VFD82_22220 [Planctomycetota bacterium]|nr:hypothetical protein [Planctomycetota bacterium]